MNIITGYRGEPHITSSQDRAKNQGMYGTGSYIMNVGQKLQAQVVSANEIRIRDGVLSHQGCVAVIENGAYDSLEISNGTQGMQRRDLIVARYTKDAETNVEDITLVVIEGTPAASNPSDPAYNEGDIQSGDSPVDFPLYRVNISGVTVSGTTRLASYVQTQAEADAAISTLNSKVNGEQSGLYVFNTGSGGTLDTEINTNRSFFALIYRAQGNVMHGPYYCARRFYGASFITDNTTLFSVDGSTGNLLISNSTAGADRFFCYVITA